MRTPRNAVSSGSQRFGLSQSSIAAMGRKSTSELKTIIVNNIWVDMLTPKVKSLIR
jgi:hypothetical protein